MPRLWQESSEIKTIEQITDQNVHQPYQGKTIVTKFKQINNNNNTIIYCPLKFDINNRKLCLGTNCTVQYWKLKEHITYNTWNINKVCCLIWQVPCQPPLYLRWEYDYFTKGLAVDTTFLMYW